MGPFGMTDEFRHEEVYALKIGATWGDCATDAIGMVSFSLGIHFGRLTHRQGIDISDIYQVIQYGVPVSLNTWYQRAGRAVRDPHLQGAAILLAEPSYFDDAKLAAAEEAKKAAERMREADEQAKEAAAAAREIRLALGDLAPVTTTANGSGGKRKRGGSEFQSAKRKRTKEPIDPDLSATRNLDWMILSMPINVLLKRVRVGNHAVVGSVASIWGMLDLVRSSLSVSHSSSYLDHRSRHLWLLLHTLWVLTACRAPLLRSL